MQLIQIEVQFRTPIGATQRITWVNVKHKVKRGNIVKFVDDNRNWEVTQVYKTAIESQEIETKWGLHLPKSQRTEK